MIPGASTPTHTAALLVSESAPHANLRHPPTGSPMRSMSQEEQVWVEQTAKGFDALVFWTIGRYGAQPLLLPRRLWVQPRKQRTPQQRSA